MEILFKFLLWIVFISPVKLVLFAHQNWGIKSVQVLGSTNHEIALVFTHPLNMDKDEKVWYDSVKTECSKLNIPVVERTNVTEDDLRTIKTLSPDLIISVGWRRLIPKSIFEIPKHGTVNFHDGLLPNYRGFAPINWAIINGETEAGLTAHFIDEDADTGDIILQKKVPIEVDDTAKNVFEKLLEEFQNMLLETLQMIESKSFKPIPQIKWKGFFCSRRFPDDGKIDWTQDRVKIHNLIRALSDPYPNTFFYFKGDKILVKNGKLTNNDYRGISGRVTARLKDGIVVTCGKDHTKNQGLLITQVSVKDEIIDPREFFNLWDNFE